MVKPRDLHDVKMIGLKDIFRCLIENIRFNPPDYQHSITVVCRQCKRVEFCTSVRKLIGTDWR